MLVAALWPVVLGAIAAFAAAKPTRTSRMRRNNVPPVNDIKFVTTENGRFTVNGSPLNFVGTNAYWLSSLSTEQDIDYSLGNISASGIKVVRTWAFNDVTSIPDSGSWFQLISDNGTVTINDGPDGLQKLDKVVELAEKHGLYLLLALTNNWNPDPLLDDITLGAGPVRRSDITIRDEDLRNNDLRPRNFLSNDFGGMDTYVRQFGLKGHEEFYTDPTVIDAFKNFSAVIAKRYTNSPAVFGWELANDPRCNSSIPATTCNPQVITEWHSDVAEYVKSVDPNHLVASGNGGHFCVDCPKLFPQTPTPPPQTSPVPGLRRRERSEFLTKARILQDRVAARKRNRLSKRNTEGGGIRIRGRWTASATRRQEDLQAVGPAFDGSFGVDSEDILNIPSIGFGSFQLFPDQYKYGVDNPALTPFENLVEQGSQWIQYHAETSALFGKPTTLNGFGLVTQANAPDFVAFNSSEAAFAPDGSTPTDTEEVTPYGVTNEQRDQAFSTWLNVGYINDLRSMIHYQWGQAGLTVAPGTPVTVDDGDTDVSPDDGVTGTSPNDGYSSNGVGRQSVVDVLQTGAQQFASDDS